MTSLHVYRKSAVFEIFSDIEKQVLASEIVKKWTEGKTPKKVIVVQGRIVNVVL